MGDGEQTVSEPVYCMFCRHCKHPASSGLPEACHHPDAPRDPVRGHLPTCIWMRSAGGPCGPAGKLYERRVMPLVEPKRAGILRRLLRFLTRGTR